MNFTPLLPNDVNGNIDAELLSMAEELCIKSATLAGSHAPQVLYGIKELLRKVNSYYSNQIESEGTHPIDIDKATKQEFSNDSKEKQLQQLSLVHIEVQKYVESYFTEGQTPYSRDFILDVHRELYSHPDMAYFLQIEDKENHKTIEMVPGKLRESNVRVGQHIAPDYSEIPSFFNKYELLYRVPNHATQAKQVIFALASHHRLMWIHSFLDGNGRTARVLAALILYLRGFDTNQFFCLDDYYDSDRPAYYKALQSVKPDTLDLTNWLEYFTEGVNISTETVKERKFEENIETYLI